MKKLLFVLSVFVLCMMSAIAVQCAEVRIGRIAQGADANTIRVNGGVVDSVDGQSLVVMVVEANDDGTYDIESQDGNRILYFNQINPSLDKEGGFSLNLKVPTGSIRGDGVYIVRIGGTNVAPVEEQFLGIDLTLGDIDGNYIITAGDAQMVFAYVLDKTKYPLTSDQLRKAAVSGLSRISAADVACILNKSYDYSYEFPVE